MKVYGKREIEYEEPLTARLDNGLWTVSGTLCCPDSKGGRTCVVSTCDGGVVVVRISQSDGRILFITHEK